MNRLILSAFTLLLSLSYSFSQTYSIQSNIFDKNNGAAVEAATVRLLNASDSSFVQAVQTDNKGHFSLNKIASGNYVLTINYLGYHQHKQSVSVGEKNVILKNIQLQEDSKLLSEVVVRGTATQMTVRGDTIEFNAGAFKLGENAVVEDLLKRLPGVEITPEGKITVNGQEVTKIRVDGKKFFEGDPEMATKNIPAELIEKVQVLEEKSEMAKLTGFEDDDTERIINLTFKDSRRRGQFGNITTGAGADVGGNFRYDANAFLNLINGDSQTAITGGANNINTARSTRGRGGFNANNGISETQNIGINNTSILSPKLSLGGDGSFNHSANNTQTESNRESYISGSRYDDYSKNTSHNDLYSVNGRLEMEWKPDSLTTFVFQPNLGYNRSISNRENEFLYLIDNDTTSVGETRNEGTNSSINGDLRLTYNRKSASKRGRSFTARVNSGFSQSDNESFNFSEKLKSTNDTTINQKTIEKSNTYKFDVRLSYVEPLWNNQNLLEMVAGFETTKRDSEKRQYDKDLSLGGVHDYDFMGEYTNFNDEYSNSFDNLFFRETAELNYRHIQKDYNLTLGIKAEPSQTYNEVIYGDGTSREVSSEVFNFAPSARFQYNFGKRQYVRVFYRGRTQQPNINQMQPVKNNSDLMSETVGNARLNPAFNHSLFSTYSSFNETRQSSLNLDFRFSAIKDALVSNTIYDETGKRYNQTVNADVTPFSFDGGVMYNTPIIKKRLHFNTNTRGRYNKQYGYSEKGVSSVEIDIDNLRNGQLSETDNYRLQQNLSLTFTHDVVEIGARGSFMYSNTQNNLRGGSPTETMDWTGSGNVVVRLPYNFTVSSDLNYTTRQGYSSFDQNELIWNASLDKTLFKNKATLSLRATDILQQRLNIRQTIGDNYVQYNSYNTLQSYFLASFTYKISKFAGMKESDVNVQDNRFGPPTGRPNDSGGRRIQTF